MTPETPAAETISAFRRGEWRTSLDRAPLPGPAGRELALVPEIVADADRRWWDSALPGLPLLTGRRELLLTALELFDSGTLTVGGVGEQSGAAFRAALWESAGLPGPLVDRWCAMLRDGVLKKDDAPEPDGALALVALPGNTFTCLDAVCDQAERSAGVWLRPSRREPVSAARLVAALLAAGWPRARLGFYPGEQRSLYGLLRLTDRHVVFGGSGLAASVRSSPALTLQGPGRGCALVPPDMPTDDAVAWLLPLIAADSGRFCSNVRTVVCEKPDAAAALAQSLAAALDALSPDGVWPLTAFREPGAARTATRGIRDRLRPGDRVLTRRPPVLHSAADDVYALPHLALLDSHLTSYARSTDDAAESHPLIGHEVPFPFAAVLSASPRAADAIAADSLFVYRPVK
ncbi:hypothetical protein DEJ49_31285 [Streptomyces venezuelae]|uniref:Aldehyde dehydrogenase domain-containing protein n=1 Tax=Streptomyces venezuelae TaxID=54571 RepID=A0A5P2CR65_STRVZ|nr:hypothetical protein [Streptomyces venezuelae]QES44883.1 hypothetical protein DEJ49_31285 [Streptomyces venezuelae]